ncbi:Ankyrin repeat domain containing protein [Mycena venus]|uniref:Ankyrin repeat domain containing protein n=1 Tax=Mycena venus TaxID=2733690 RepID=A0A8H6XVG3_9AGAR|nr:Ankyrin repeat domain containing protein [Mycena venus]
MSEFSDLPPELILHTVTFLTREITVALGNHVAGRKTVNGTEELVPDLPSINALSRTNTFLYRILNRSLYDLCAGVPSLGKFALLFTVKHQLENAVERLVSAGVSLDTEFLFKGSWCRSLHIAAAMGHRSMVVKLLQLSGDEVATMLYHKTRRHLLPTATPLDYAAQRGHMDIVRLLAPIPYSMLCSSDISNGVPLPRASDRFEKHKQYLSVALVDSARAGNREISEYLVSEGADVNFTREDAACGTPLYWAAGTNNLALVQFLLASGADPDLQPRNAPWYITLFNAAAHNHDVEIVQALVAAGADIHVKDDDSCTVLGICTDVQLLRFFLERGVDPNAEDRNKMTALHRACAKKDAEFAKASVELLLQFGASPVARTSLSASRLTPVDIAMNRGYSEVVKILEPLVENPELLGEDCKVVGKEKRGGGKSVPNLGKLALLFAVKHQLENAVERLVSAGVSLDTEFRLDDTDFGLSDRRWPTDMRCCSLQIAAFMGHRSMVVKVLQLSGDEEAKRLYYKSRYHFLSTATALDYAAQHGDMDIAKLLAPIPMLSPGVCNDSTPCSTDVSNGVPLPRASDRFEKHKQYLSMALVESARAGNREISEYLVSEGADVNFVREDAISSSLLALTQISNPDVHMDISPLFNAAAHDHDVETVQALVAAGADIHVKDHDSSTVLWLCLDVKLLRFFLERGVDPNAESRNKMTALHIACAQNDAEFAKASVDLLLQFGAGPVDRTSLSAGRPTAVDIAMNRGYSEVVKILEPLVENPELLGKIAKCVEGLGRLALLFAVKHQLESTLDKLVAAGISLDGEFDSVATGITFDRCSLLHIAAAMGREAMVVKLLELYGEEMETRVHTRHGWSHNSTALDYAARYERMKVVRLLAPIPLPSIPIPNRVKGQDVHSYSRLPPARRPPNFKGFETRSQYLSLALIESIKAGSGAISEYLISEGADVNFISEICDAPPLHYAARTTLQLVQLLLSSGADPNVHKGYIPLITAVRCQYVDIVQALVDAGANIHVQDRGHHNVLAYCTTLELLRFFLERGVDPNNEDDSGRTALHNACMEKNAMFAKASVELLLEFGAGPVDRPGIAAVDLAMALGHSEIVKLFEPLVQNPDLKLRIAAWWREREGDPAQENILDLRRVVGPR